VKFERQSNHRYLASSRITTAQPTRGKGIIVSENDGMEWRREAEAGETEQAAQQAEEEGEACKTVIANRLISLMRSLVPWYPVGGHRTIKKKNRNVYITIV